MLKKTVNYTDYNGDPVTEDVYFNLTPSELIEMEAGPTGSMAERLKGIVGEKNNTEILKAFKEIVLLSYGQRSEDGRRFIKNDQLREEFEQSPAFDEVLLSIMLDPEEASTFINNVIPTNLAERVQAQGQRQTVAPREDVGARAQAAIKQGFTNAKDGVPNPTPEQIADYIRNRGSQESQTFEA